MVIKLQNNYEDCFYPSDVERIVKVAALHGVILSPQEAEKAWQERSDCVCAGWINLPDNEIVLWNELPNWARGE